MTCTAIGALNRFLVKNDFSSIGAGTIGRVRFSVPHPFRSIVFLFSGGSEDTQYYLSLNAFGSRRHSNKFWF